MTASDDIPSVDHNEQISQKFGRPKSCKLNWRQNKQYFASWLKKRASAKKFTIGCKYTEQITFAHLKPGSHISQTVGDHRRSFSRDACDI